MKKSETPKETSNTNDTTDEFDYGEVNKQSGNVENEYYEDE